MTVGAQFKVVVGLGNPGRRYQDTRHNVGWWVLDRFAYDHDFGSFSRRAKRLESNREMACGTVVLIKPRTYMNRSGLALTTLWQMDGFDLATDLLVVVDDVNLDLGRVRFRSRGGAGGHNGLRSVSATLGTHDYARLRVGVGPAPAGADLADWVLSAMPAEEEDRMVALLPELSQAVEAWVEHGIEHAMNKFNR